MVFKGLTGFVPSQITAIRMPNLNQPHPSWAGTLHGAAVRWLLAAGQMAITDVYKRAEMDAGAGWQSANQQNMLFLAQLLDLSSAKNIAVWHEVFL